MSNTANHARQAGAKARQAMQSSGDPAVIALAEGMESLARAIEELDREDGNLAQVIRQIKRGF
ncbi:MAG: hypothetical protein PGN27_04290 [Mycolicibacterium neoaurum]|uniref:hypothetical protein n=1 Tax=Mycolicibacterium neoaurum TaxID=1795 RepID=UPI002FF8BB07